MTREPGTSRVVDFAGEWTGQVVASSVHAGHGLRPEIAAAMVLDEDVRLREEDPHTDVIAGQVPARVVTGRSRFEVDLNRARDEAVYRSPEDCWGLDVWADPPLPDDLTAGSLAEYDEFYVALGERLDIVAARGPFVLLDVHSYNHRRGGADADPEPVEGNPEVNLGTGSVDKERFGPLVEDFMASLSRQEVGGVALDVRENVRFQGRALAAWVHDRYPGVGCCLALEFKKTFMDEWTAEVDADRVEQSARALARTVPVLEQRLRTLT
jgi:N-formylglutamate deformylase